MEISKMASREIGSKELKTGISLDSGGHDKNFMDCMVNSLRPKNWSHIEKLKSQKNRLQEKLSSQTQNVKLHIVKGQASSLDQGTEKATFTELITEEDSKMSAESNPDTEIVNRVLIADEESNTKSMLELSNPSKFCEIERSKEKPVLQATCCTIQDHNGLKQSQSLTDCPGSVYDEDEDLCELRVSNINRSLFTAIANVENSELKNSKNIIEKEIAKSQSDGEDNSNSVKSIAKPLDDQRNCFNSEKSKFFIKAKSSKYTRDKHLHRSFSDTVIQSKEALRQRLLMRQKFKCFLKGKTKNDLLERMLMRKLKSNLSTMDPSICKRKVLDEDDNRKANETEKPIQTENHTSYCKTSKTFVDDINKNHPKCQKVIRTELEDRMKEHNKAKMKLLQQQIETLKMEQELAKMKTKLLQNTSLCKYLSVLEGRCNTVIKDIAENNDNSLKTSDNYSDAFLTKASIDKMTSITSREVVTSTANLNCGISQKMGENGNITYQKIIERDSVSINPISVPKELPVNTPKIAVTSKNEISTESRLKAEEVEEKQVLSPSSLPIPSNKISKAIDLKSSSLSLKKAEGPQRSGTLLANPCTISMNNFCSLASYPKSTVSNVSYSGKESCLVQNESAQSVYAVVNNIPIYHPTQIVSSAVLFVPNAVNQTLQTCKTNLHPITSVVYSMARPSTQIGNVAVINAVPIPYALTPSKNAQIMKVISPPSKPLLATTCTTTLTSSDKYSIVSTQKKMEDEKINSRRTKVENTDLVKPSESKQRFLSPLNTTLSRTEKMSCQGKDTQNVLIFEGSWKSQNRGHEEIRWQRSIVNPVTFENDVKSVKASAEKEKIKCYQSTTRVPQEVASMNKVKDVHATSNKPSSKNNIVKEYSSNVTRNLDATDTYSDSNDSFDSVDLLHYEIQKGQNRNAVVSSKNKADVKPEALPVGTDLAKTRTDSCCNEAPHTHNIISNKTSSICGSVQLQSSDEKKRDLPTLISVNQQMDGRKKYMKTKFIILKGDICDKWLDIKRKVGFASLPDPSFVHYLLDAMENRQKPENRNYKEQLQLVTERNVNNNSTSFGNNKVKLYGGNIIPVLQERLNVQANVVKIQSPKLKTQELSNKKHMILKRPAQKRVKLEATASEPKKAKYDFHSGVNHELEKDRYNFFSKSTKKQMTWAVTIFREWLKRQNVRDPKFEYQGTAWLNMMLEKFYKEAHSFDKKKYSADTLQNLRRSLSIYLEGHPQSNCVNISIPIDPGFGSSNQALTDIMKNRLSLSPEDNLPITSEDFEKMYTSNTLSDRNPDTLLWKVWFDISFYLCSGQYPENFMNSLKKCNLALQSDVNGVFYTFTDDVCLPPEDTLTKMYATPDVPDRCPVRTTTVYLSQLCDDCDALFQRPRALWKPGKKWYLPASVSVEKLNNMMKKISKVAKLSKVYKTSNVLATAKLAKKSQ